MSELEAMQLGLFGDADPPASRLSREHDAARALASRIREDVRFGTSSWTFPGWDGLVYSRRRSSASLAKDGLIEYARHPLLRAVGIDRSFYAPVPESDLRRYAAQLPAGFRCLAKAPEAVTSAEQADFLRPQRFLEECVEPFLRALADRTGPFLLQFPPAPPSSRPGPEAFAARLDRFLAALPREARYAVELRDPAFLGEAYRQVLAAHGAAHVYNYATAMPMPAAQAALLPVDTAGFAVIRLLLRPGSRYQDRKDAFSPFAAIQDPDETMRRQVVDLIRRAHEARRPSFVLVNNKAEGSAPLTIRALAERLIEGGQG